MTPAEFFRLAGELVGEEPGKPVRIARLLGVSLPQVYQIHAGKRPLPRHYADKLRQAVAEAEQRGRWLGYLAPRLQRAVEAAVRAGAGEREAVAAVAGWAALRLAGHE